MKKLSSLFIIIPFLFIIFSIPIMFIFSEDTEFSEEEYRNLTTVEILKEENYSPEALSEYVVDQFPYRPYLLKLYTQQELFLNKILIRDTYLIDKSLILMKEYDLNKEKLAKLFLNLEEKKKKYDDVSFYYSTVPSKTYALREYVKEYMDISIPIKNKEITKHYIPNNIIYIDANDYLDKNFTNEEKLYLYYKTDFHWNAIGAFNSFNYILSTILKYERDNINIDSSDFNIEYLKERNFLGDLNRRYSYLIEKDNNIPVIYYKNFHLLKYYLKLDNSEQVERKQIIGNGIAKKDLTYNDIYTGNLEFYKVVNDDALLDKKIIIFKDSYQNPTIDLFSYVFKECNIIDLRYFNEVENFDELMKAVSPDIVLFVYHQSNISDELISFLEK